MKSLQFLLLVCLLVNTNCALNSNQEYYIALDRNYIIGRVYEESFLYSNTVSILLKKANIKHAVPVHHKTFIDIKYNYIIKNITNGLKTAILSFDAVNSLVINNRKSDDISLGDQIIVEQSNFGIQYIRSTGESLSKASIEALNLIFASRNDYISDELFEPAGKVKIGESWKVSSNANILLNRWQSSLNFMDVKSEFILDDVSTNVMKIRGYIDCDSIQDREINRKIINSYSETAFEYEIPIVDENYPYSAIINGRMKIESKNKNMTRMDMISAYSVLIKSKLSYLKSGQGINQ